MGGSINFVHRDDAGKVTFGEIYTSGMYILQGSRLVKEKKDFSHLLKEWYGDEACFDPTHICPGGYGIFVIDYLHNEMYGIQDYCGIGEYYSDPYNPSMHESEREVLIEYINRGEIEKVEYFDGQKHQTIKRTETKPITEELVRSINCNKLFRGNMTFTLDMSPMQCISFPDGKRGYSKLKKHMLSRDFQIYEKEWKAFVKDIDY